MTVGLQKAHLRLRAPRTPLRGLLVSRTAAVEVAITNPKTFSPETTYIPSNDSKPVAFPDWHKNDDTYNWYTQWYPVAAVECLQPDRPNGIQLLGMKLVLWQDQTGTWRCFEDACPHRLAPLSEGRIHSDGTLMCSYHGWTFNADGNCTNIPQISDPKALATACSSSRACVKKYPTQVSQGLIWVWADASAESWLTAPGSTPSVLPAELASGEYDVKGPWFQRDAPLSLDTLVENFIDPSHVPFSHHGVVGDRGADQSMQMTRDTPISKDGGFSVEVKMPMFNREYMVDFKPPCLVKYNWPGVTMLLYGISTAPGWCRIIMSNIGPKDSKQTRPATPQLPAALNVLLNFIDNIPALQHAITRNAIIDGDTYFLHAAERTLYSNGGTDSWTKQYYMPASADAGVLAWRKWMDKYGSTLPTLPKTAADLPPLMPRQQVFDRYSQHTASCPHCSQALNTINVAVVALLAVAAVAAASLVTTFILGGLPSVMRVAPVGVAVAAVASMLAGGLLNFRKKFLYEDYVHAEH
eukprot:jgi/Chrzof1/4581/Cz14g19030.t1_PAO3[v5.2]